MNEKELKPREELFCRKFAELYNGTEAALAVGYGKRRDGSVSRKSAEAAAYKLRKRPEIKARISELMLDCANEAGATPIYIAQKLKEVADRCMQEVKPELVWDGSERKMVETGDYTFNARDAIGALKVLADIQGLNKTVKDFDVGATVKIINDIPKGGGDG